MAAISGIEAAGALPAAPARDQRGSRAAVEFGGAITHREMVTEKLRVDPAALADKKRAARASRRDDEPRESQRSERNAQEDAAADERRDERMGQNVDISV
jgi:hypothetical protein